tara:strand:+ start:78383 stop:80689 length:2307 start_codon:yes stop_codon:yes gene_type:complete
MLYVNHEESYDKFDGSDQVYRVYMDYLEGNEYMPGDANAYIVSGPTLKNEFPEIKDYVRLRRVKSQVLLYDNKIFDNQTGALTDPSYFRIFDRGLKKGDINTALNEPYSIVLSAFLAQKIFGEVDPIGQSLKIAGGGDALFSITGVMNSNVPNSHINNDFLVSFKTFYTWPVFSNDWKYTWNQNEYFTYLTIDENANVNQLNQKVMNFTPEGLQNERHHLEPIEEIHLYSNKPYEAEANGSGDSVKLLAMIAFIILLLSWMNYVNLSTSKSLERAKEIGVRKVVGARRPQLILQSLIESGLLNFIAILLGIVAVYILLPLFNKFVDLELQLDIAQMGRFLPYFCFILVGVFLSSFYPAFVLSSYKPVKVLKWKLHISTNGFNMRKALITGQFLATIALLTCAFMAKKQIRYLQNRPIGAKLDNLVSLNGRVLNSNNDSLLHVAFNTLVSELKKSPSVENVALAQTYPGDNFGNLNSNIGVIFPDGRKDVKQVWYNYAAQPEYFDLMQMEFVAGEPFSQTAMGRSNNIVINEKMADFIGITDRNSATGKTIRFWDQEWTINGILKDYHHFGLKSPIEPFLITHNNNTANVLVKLDKRSASMASTAQTLDQLDNIWHQVFPESTYNYTFLDQNFANQYKQDRQFAMAFQIFTILAILIASMGLFGLSSYSVVQRKKEIGIRKVNGASVGQILQLLNKDFIKWVGVAFLAAVPISWFVMHKWLQGFAYRAEISWWLFVLAGITALLIALLTVSWQSFQAAISNPIDSLSDE